MNELILRLILRYQKSGILVDTNILLLYFLGGYDPTRITRFKRTAQFVPEDYTLLRSILRRFVRVVTTPNILTEVSNFSGQLGEPTRSSYFKKFAEEVCLVEEHYIRSQEVARTDEFITFGLTDGAILRLARGTYLVLTDDLRLYEHLTRLNLDAVNFNHVRPLGWT